MRYRMLLLVLVGTGFLFVSRSAAQPATPPVRLLLKSGEIIPTSRTAPDQPAHANPDHPTQYIVQFREPIRPEWRTVLTDQGIIIQSYLPQYAYKVRMTPAQASTVAQMSAVNWVGPYSAVHKMATDGASQERSVATPMMLVLSDSTATSRIQSWLAERTIPVIQASVDRLVVLATPAQRRALIQEPLVDWIEPFQLNQTFGSGALDQEGGVVLKANVARSRGYTGSTQTIAVADTGLSTGAAASVHPDMPATRIRAIYDWPASDAALCYDAIPNGAQDVSSGHGTHVALAAAGGGGSNGEGQGVAPQANLVFQSIEDYVDFNGICASQREDGYYLLGLPSTKLFDLFYQAASSGGAFIHSNSWGADVSGDYDSQAQQVDEYAWLLKSRTLLFAAGNSGVDANQDGVVDSDSIASPATAKNVISVGASENDRKGHYQCDSSLTYAGCNGQNPTYFAYGDLWPDSYPTAPLRTDLAAGNSEQMAGFSSRGPTDDGRIKPDVVAPGTWVLSGYSAMYRQGYDGAHNPQTGEWQDDGAFMPYNRHYKYMFGTSMATPLAAGSAAIVRDFYAKRHSLTGSKVSSALIKATLINTADDLLDENNDGVNDNDFPIPNIHEGWGRINLDTATSNTYSFVMNSPGLTTGGATSSTYTVTGANQPCRITLVWTDFPADPAAATSLVNDLDLVVTAPNGTIYRGNVFASGWSSAGGAADRVNTVENVYIRAAAMGAWTVQVQAFNIPQGPQPYALVVRCATAAPTTVAIAASTATKTPEGVTLRWESAREDGIQGFHVYRSSDTLRDHAVQITDALIPRQGSGGVYHWKDTSVQPGSTYRYWIEAKAADSSTSEYGPISVIDQQRVDLYLPQVIR